MEIYQKNKNLIIKLIYIDKKKFIKKKFYPIKKSSVVKIKFLWIFITYKLKLLNKILSNYINRKKS